MRRGQADLIGPNTFWMKEKVNAVMADITTFSADAIVNAANTSLLGGGGVDGAIHRAGGPEILAECRKIRAAQGGCSTGEAVITGGGKLSARFVIHTVGPVWNGGTSGEPELLAKCYSNSLRLAVASGCRSVAFPSISTGVYRYPKPEAAKVAVRVVREFLTADQTLDSVTFVCFDEENLGVMQSQLDC